MERITAELKAHLRRLLVWAGVSLGAGGAILALVPGAFWQGVGGMTVGWAAINAVIGLASLKGKPPKSESQFREFLWLNQGLNLGYVGVGVTLALSHPGLGPQGFGWAVVVQGLGLFALDGILLRRTRTDSASVR